MKIRNLLYLILLVVCLSSCEDEPKCYTYKTVLSVSPQHSTRIFVTYVSQCGDTIISSEHWSTTIKADNITFFAGDYLNGKLKYGVVK